MEIGIMNYRKVSLGFVVVLTLCYMFHSCTNQRSLAVSSRQDTIIVPKQYRPSTLRAIQAKQEPQTKQHAKKVEDHEKEFIKALNKENPQLDLKSLQQLYDAIQVLANDRVNVAESYRDMKEHSKALESKLDSLNSKVVKAEVLRRLEAQERKKAEMEAKVRDAINDNIMKYGLICVIFFSLLTLVSIWITRSSRKSKLTNLT